MTLSFKYPDGSAVTGTLNYAVASSLLSFNGSQPLVNGLAECDLFANPSAMGISAQFQVTLSLTDTGGHILWQINLGMNPAQVNLGGAKLGAKCDCTENVGTVTHITLPDLTEVVSRSFYFF